MIGRCGPTAHTTRYAVIGSIMNVYIDDFRENVEHDLSFGPVIIIDNLPSIGIVKSLTVG